MLGAVIGDIIGSPYEGGMRAIKTTEFPLFSKNSEFTDDSILTLAIAQSLLRKSPYAKNIREFYFKYPEAGYGGRFIEWAKSRSTKPYGSYGNGSAMRVSPVAWVYSSMDSVLREAKKSSAVTHSHPEGIKGAESVAACIFLARQKKSKSEIQAFIEKNFGYSLKQSVGQIRQEYGYDSSAEGSVPHAIRCFLEADSFEEAVRLAVSLGGDSDTQAAIAGSIAEAAFGIPEAIKKEGLKRLPKELNQIITRFQRKFGVK